MVRQVWCVLLNSAHADVGVTVVQYSARLPLYIMPIKIMNCLCNRQMGWCTPMHAWVWSESAMLFDQLTLFDKAPPAHAHGIFHAEFRHTLRHIVHRYRYQRYRATAPVTLACGNLASCTSQSSVRVYVQRG